jgi:hypothetical protein
MGRSYGILGKGEENLIQSVYKVQDVIQGASMQLHAP